MQHSDPLTRAVWPLVQAPMPKLVAAIVVVVLVLITIDLRAQTPDAFSPGTAAVSGSAGGGAAGRAEVRLHMHASHSRNQASYTVGKT